jgi:GxxExxY protein
MPIHRTLELQSVSDADFDVIDEAVMRCAYATQNKFGRLFDERIYENDLAARLRAEGFEVHTQVAVTVSHGSFEKTYYLDLIVNHMIYELKVVASLLEEHRAQGFHYAMLQNIRRVKLINFGEAKVRGDIVRNAITEEARHQPTLRKAGWRVLSPNCERLFDHLKAIIKDWGMHLSSQIYNEALIHHFGGEAHCLRRLEVCSGNLTLGTHPVQMHSEQHAFTLTSLTRNHAAFRQHLVTLMEHTELKAIQWINLNHARVEITTLERGGV